MTAKSRLKPETKKALIGNQVAEVKKSKTRTPISSESKKVDLKKYLKHSPMLIFSIPFFLYCYNLVTTKFPDEIVSSLIPGFYLRLIVPLFFGLLFLTSYLFLSIKRGINTSFFIVLIVFLRLQKFVFEIWWLAIIMFIFFIMDILIKKRA